MMCWLIGWQAFLLIQGPIVFIASSLGIWLFYIQHHFEDSYFEEDARMGFCKSGRRWKLFLQITKMGSMDYWKYWLPPCSSFKSKSTKLLPRGRTQSITDELNSVPTVTIRTSLKALKYRLWDERKTMNLLVLRKLNKRAMQT